MNPDVSNWPNAAEACARLGISRATLDREVGRGNLHPLKRPRRANRPELVFDPDEIQSKMKAEEQPVRAAVPVTAVSSRVAESVPPVHAPMRDLREPPANEEAQRLLARALEMLYEARKAPALWVDLEEASTLTGLSRRLLYRLAKKEALYAVRDGKIMVRREDLEDVDTDTEKFRPKRKTARKVKK